MCSLLSINWIELAINKFSAMREERRGEERECWDSEKRASESKRERENDALMHA
jgi:hypothetical protein